MSGPTSLTPAPTVTITAPTPLAGAPHIQPQFDVIESLPEGAPRDRYRAMVQRRADSHALTVPHSDLQAASMERINSERELQRLTDHPQDGGFGLPVDAPQVVAGIRTRDKATAAFERLKQLSEVRSAQWQAGSQALSAVETFLREHGTKLETVQIEPAKLLKGESVTDAVDRVRRRGRELRADLARIAAAPFPSAYAKGRMRTQIAALAQLGAPSVSVLVEHDGKIEWPTQRVQSEVLGERLSLGFHEAVNLVALEAWLHKDAMIAALDREIDAESDDSAALTHEARQEREAELRRDLLACEFEESGLVWRGIQEKLPVDHRAECSPLAILGCRMVPSAATNGQQTWVQHAWDLLGGGR